MAGDHPAHVARAVGPEHDRSLGGLAVERIADDPHGPGHGLALLRRERLEHRLDLRLGAAVQPPEQAQALVGQTDAGAAAIVGVDAAGQQSRALEPAQHAADIAGVQVQRMPQRLGGGGSALRQLIDQARLGEGEAAVQVGLVQHPDPARVESVEAADPIHFRRHLHHGHARLQATDFRRGSCLSQTVWTVFT